MERTLSKLITYPVNGSITDALPSTIAGRTRRVYDALSLVYPMSTFFFHSKAHEYALEVSGIRDGMRVLEVATGSGEMFHRLVPRIPAAAPSDWIFRRIWRPGHSGSSGASFPSRGRNARPWTRATCRSATRASMR